MSYPTSPIFNEISIESESPTLSSTSVNGRIQSRKIGGQKWTFTANYPPMTQAQFKPGMVKFSSYQALMNYMKNQLILLSLNLLEKIINF